MTERAKTDASLSHERDSTEHNADAAVSLNRAKADKLRSEERFNSDSLCEAERAGQHWPDAENRLETDQRLYNERLVADKALDLERRHVDSVLESERWKKKAFERKFFQFERNETDQNLNLERSFTDNEAKRASDALTTRDDFLAIVSHDLRNPLGSISLAADLLIESPIYLSSSEEDREFIDLIKRNADDALRLIEDLLDVERMGTGKLSVDLKDNSIAEIIQVSLSSFGPQAQANQLSLEMDAAFEIQAACDRDRILQALSNLIGNAIKFTPSGGRIVVSVVPGEREIQIKVSDTGPGIPSNLQTSVFERLRQLGKESRHGLGLGLYISKMIVEAHKGRIWVESEVGHGSEFCFTIPTQLS